MVINDSPCPLTNEHTGLGIEPITADKHRHDTQLVCSPPNVTHFLFSAPEKKKKELMFQKLELPMYYAFAFRCAQNCVNTHPARVVADLCARLCNGHCGTAVMDGVLCCSSGAISQPESSGWPPRERCTALHGEGQDRNLAL